MKNELLYLGLTVDSSIAMWWIMGNKEERRTNTGMLVFEKGHQEA